MSSSHQQLWDAAVGNPFEPLVSKNRQFLVGFTLLMTTLIFTGFFALNRSILTVPLFGVPASIAFGFGAVYMICAVGVYLYLLLRCINFSDKTQVQISSEGLRFSVEKSHSMQGLAFLDKDLFTTYTYKAPPPPPAPSETQDSSDPDADSPIFQISLPSLLETLSIFGFADTARDRPYRDTTYTSGINGPYAIGGMATNAFDNRILGMSGICRLSYVEAGDPLRIALEENSVKTTCALTTYEPEAFEDIPFDRDALTLKVIMRASLLHDAINELASLHPARLSMTASPAPPTSTPAPAKSASFSLSAKGHLGSASVDFTNEPGLLETFQCMDRTRNVYDFSLLRDAQRAMAIASKVSIRGDHQGVLSLQFMIEVEGGGVSFVDFRFVAFVPEENSGDDEFGEDDNDAGGLESE